MFEQTFKNIDDVLWKEAGCATALKQSLLQKVFSGELTAREAEATARAPRARRPS